MSKKRATRKKATQQAPLSPDITDDEMDALADAMGRFSDAELEATRELSDDQVADLIRKKMN